MSCNKAYIIIVQGDTSDITVDMTGEAVSAVQSVEMTITSQSVKKSAVKVSDNEWVVSFTSEETKALKAETTSYCITATFTGNKIATTVYDGVVSIRQKE